MTLQNKLDDRNGFKHAKRGSEIVRGVSYSSVVARNRFQILEHEIRDNLARHQDEEFSRKDPRRKNVCYPGRRVENLTENIDELVANSLEETVFIYQIGTNNVVKNMSEQVYDKYKTMTRKIRDSRKRSVVCGLIPRYDISSQLVWK